MLSLLIADDNQTLRKDLKTAIGNQFTVYESDNGLEALETSKRDLISIFMINASLPFITGKDFLSSFGYMSTTPVIIYGENGETIKKAYPFVHWTPRTDIHSLVRVIDIIRENYFGESDDPRYYTIEDLEIDYYSKKLKISDKFVKLTPKEVDLLIFLAINEGKAFSREDLLTKVWGYDFLGDSRTIDTHVKSLRSKLRNHRNLITTIWGKGYKFERPSIIY